MESLNIYLKGKICRDKNILWHKGRKWIFILCVNSDFYNENIAGSEILRMIAEMSTLHA